jgi:hypothetical protein
MSTDYDGMTSPEPRVSDAELKELRNGARLAVENFPSAKNPRVKRMYSGFASACDELLALRSLLASSREAIETGARFIDYVTDRTNPESANQAAVIAADKRQAAQLRALAKDIQDV